MEAKISISVKEGKFEISGSEDFVNKQIENFRDLITETVNSVEPEPVDKTTNFDQSNTKSSTNGSSIDQSSNSSLEQYPYVFVEDGDSIMIVCDLPGSSNAEKTFNAALLYAYAKKLKGEEEAQVEDIRDIARNHGVMMAQTFLLILILVIQNIT